MYNLVCQWLVADRWFSPGTPVSSTNKTDRHDITEILLKVALNTIIITLTLCATSDVILSLLKEVSILVEVELLKPLYAETT